MTMTDPTEPIREALITDINSNPSNRQEFEAEYGRVWSTDELARDFAVLGFMAPFVVVRRKSDGCKGSLMFTHLPRFYFYFQED